MRCYNYNSPQLLGEAEHNNIVISQWQAGQLFAEAVGGGKYRDLRDMTNHSSPILHYACRSLLTENNDKNNATAVGLCTVFCCFVVARQRNTYIELHK